jgi:uncharacterized protein
MPMRKATAHTRPIWRLAAVLALAFLALFAAAPADGLARVQAHPATWQVASQHGSAVLFGSQHVLPANVDWMTPELEKALAAADVLVFEAPLDADTFAAFRTLMAERGMLPAGRTLRSLLPPDAGPKLDQALAMLHWPETMVGDKRPWLAAFMFDSELIRRQMQNAVAGPDLALMQRAKRDKTEIRYLETAESQLALIAPADSKVELQLFMATIDDAKTADSDLKEMSTAWINGDAAALEKLIMQNSEGMPQFRDYFFTDRNTAMAAKIAAMLKEDKKFVVVVGAGHMVGKDGIPALLRAQGFKIEGP